MNIGEKIKHLRLINKMTQEDVANRLFLSRQVISKCELGKSLPDLINLLALSKLFKGFIAPKNKKIRSLHSQL